MRSQPLPVQDEESVSQIIPMILKNPEWLMFLSSSSADPILIDAQVQGHRISAQLVLDVGIVKAGVQQDHQEGLENSGIAQAVVSLGQGFHHPVNLMSLSGDAGSSREIA